jgi:hypothetical protein
MKPIKEYYHYGTKETFIKYVDIGMSIGIGMVMEIEMEMGMATAGPNSCSSCLHHLNISMKSCSQTFTHPNAQIISRTSTIIMLESLYPLHYSRVKN